MEVNNKLYTENGIKSKETVDNFKLIVNKYKIIGASIHINNKNTCKSYVFIINSLMKQIINWDYYL